MSIGVIDKAAALMRYLSKCSTPQKTTAIAAALDQPKATVSRLLSSLAEHDLVIKDQNGLYRLGPTSLLWAAAYKAQRSFIEVCKPYMLQIMESVKETVHLFSYDQRKLHYVERVEAVHPLVTRFGLSDVPKMHCTGGGKAVLMALPPEELDAVLAAPLPQMTERTITDSEFLRKQLELFRVQGFSEEVGEHEDGIRCVGVPLLSGGYPVGAISIAMASYRCDDAQARKSGQLLVEFGRTISQRIG